MNKTDVAQLAQLAVLRARREERAQRDLDTKRRERRTAEKLVRIIDSKLNAQRDRRNEREQAFAARLQDGPVSGRVLEQLRLSEAVHAQNYESMARERQDAADRCDAIQQECDRLAERYRKKRQQHDAVKTLLARRQRAETRRAEQRAELASD